MQHTCANTKFFKIQLHQIKLDLQDTQCKEIYYESGNYTLTV